MLNRRTALLTPIFGLVSGCDRSPKLSAASKENVESSILCEIAAVLLEKKLKAKVQRRLNFGGSSVLLQALQSGDIDIYPEYSRIAYKVLLKTNEPIDATMSTDKVIDEFRKSLSAIWLPPLGFDNSYTAVVRADDERFASIANLSAAAEDKAGWKLGCTSDFAQSPEGYSEFKSVYKLPERIGPRLEPVNQLYFGLGDKRIDILITGSTDPRLTNKKYKVLADDKTAFSPNRASLVVRQPSDVKYPELVPTLKLLSGKIDSDSMRKLNAQAEIDKRGLTEIAQEWLSKSGLA